MKKLVCAAQRGEPEAVTAVWDAVKRLAFKIANQYHSTAVIRGGADREDLEQCAALGVLEALHSYDPAKGAFTSWLEYYVRNACRSCLGLDGGNRPDNCSVISLDTPIGGIADELTIGDTIPDEAATRAFEAAEHAHDNAILRRDLDAALARLPASWCDAIRKHDLEGHTLSPDEIQPRKSGLQRLRRDPRLTAYRPNYHRHKGLAAFRTSWSSVVEDEVIKMLDRRI